jgi:hypothetical protein
VIKFVSDLDKQNNGKKKKDEKINNAPQNTTYKIKDDTNIIKPCG